MAEPDIRLGFWIEGSGWNTGVGNDMVQMGQFYETKLGRTFGVRPRGAYGDAGNKLVNGQYVTADWSFPLIKSVTKANHFCDNSSGLGFYSTNIKFWPSSPQGKDQNPPMELLQHTVDGRNDQWLVDQVPDIHAVHGPVYIEVFSEANVGGSPAQPAASDGPWDKSEGGGGVNPTTIERWKQTYLRIHDQIEAEFTRRGWVSNVIWVISLAGTAVHTDNGDAGTFIKPVLDYEASSGRHVLDMIGHDAYTRNGNNKTPSAMFTQGMNYAYSKNKLYGIFETGAWEGENANDAAFKASWYTLFGQFATTNKAKIDVIILTLSESHYPPEFNYYPIGDPRNGIYSGPNTTPSWATFKAFAQLPVFDNAGTSTGVGRANITGTGTLHAAGTVTQIGSVTGSAAAHGTGTLNATGLTQDTSGDTALAISHVTESYDNSDQTTSYTIGSFTMTKGQLYLLTLLNFNPSTAVSPASVASTSVTFAKAVGYVSGTNALTCWWAIPAATVTEAVTVTIGSSIDYGMQWSIEEVLNNHPTAPIGVTATNFGSSGTTGAVTLSGYTTGAGRTVYSAFSLNALDAIVAGTHFTLLDTQQEYMTPPSTAARTLGTIYDDDDDDFTVSATWAGSASWRTLALEIIPSSQFQGAAALTGSGSMTAIANVIPLGIAALSGTGTLVSAGEVTTNPGVITATAALTGLGTLTVPYGVKGLESGANLTGMGQLNALAATEVPTGRHTVRGKVTTYNSVIGSVALTQEVQGRIRLLTAVADVPTEAHLTATGSILVVWTDEVPPRGYGDDYYGSGTYGGY